MVGHDEPAIRVEATDPQEIARRMVASNWYEQQPLVTTYMAYRFAFPERRNDFMERAQSLQSEILASALAGKVAYTVSHPYPVSLPALYAAMRPHCEAPAPASAPVPPAEPDTSASASGAPRGGRPTGASAGTALGRPRVEAL
jgi:hypothetical protein